MADQNILKTAEGRPFLQRHGQTLVLVGFALVYVALVLFSHRSLFFDKMAIPDGDMAADDILVFRAKSLHLLVGNYSRVGFNHPGPFFMQVEAWSEILFHDLLHLFPSYAAAQTFGMAVLQGLALGAALRLWLLVTGDALAAVAALLTLVATINLAADRNVFVNLWNPYSYVAGAGFFVTGLVGLWARGLRWAPLAALGAVALVHGHASFIGLVPVILAVFAILAVVRYGRAIAANPATATDAIRRHWGALALTAAVLALGALPVVMNLALHWPGELPSYFGFAHQGKSNPPLAAVKYVWSFLPLLGVWLLLLLLPGRDELGRASLAVLAAGLAAALLYALRGIDDLSFRYLLLWASVFIGVAFGAAVIRFLAVVDRPNRRVLVLAVAACACWASFRHLSVFPVEKGEGARLRAAADELKALAAPGQKVAIELDPSAPSWVPSSIDTVSVLALLQREGNQPLCVEQGWHVLFSREYRCGPKDHIERRIWMADPTENPGGVPLARLYRVVAYSVGESGAFDVAPTAFARAGVQLSQGWSTPEGGWIWSDGPASALSIPMRGAPARLTLKGMVYSDGKTPQKVTLVGPDGATLAQASALDGDVTLSATVNPPRPGPLQMGLRIDHPVSPQSLGRSGDPRRLGFGLKEIRLEPAP